MSHPHASRIAADPGRESNGVPATVRRRRAAHGAALCTTRVYADRSDHRAPLDR